MVIAGGLLDRIDGDIRPHRQCRALCIILQVLQEFGPADLVMAPEPIIGSSWESIGFPGTEELHIARHPLPRFSHGTALLQNHTWKAAPLQFEAKRKSSRTSANDDDFRLIL